KGIEAGDTLDLGARHAQRGLQGSMASGEIQSQAS
ncbi:MAG: hypothetical protein RLZZ300_2064, partial [Pseudomonadota bacterium]